MSDWIPHKRGKCPVAGDAYVIVRWEGEECYGPNRADSWTWHTEDAPREYMEVETVSKAHLARLRAEVASLKEERDGLAESVQGMYDTLHTYWPGTINELLEDWQRLTQQLAAANAKIDALMREYCPGEMTPEQVIRAALPPTEDANAESQKPTPAQAYYMMPCAQLLAQAQDSSRYAGTGEDDGEPD